MQFYCSKDFSKIDTLKSVIDYAAESYGSSVAIKAIGTTGEIEISYLEFQKRVQNVSTFIRRSHMDGCHIALIGEFTYQWFLAFCGVVYSGNVAVPFEKDPSVENLLEMCGRTDISFVFVDEEDAAPELLFKLTELGKDFCGFDEIDFISNELSFSPESACFDDVLDTDALAVLINTTGTTGRNKIVMLTHGNLSSNICASVLLIDDRLHVGQRTLPLLPPHHLLGLCTGSLVPLYCGVALCFGGGIKHFESDLKLFKPVGLVVVPMVIEFLYKKIWQNVRKQKRSKVFHIALKINKLLKKVGLGLGKCIFKSIHKNFGGKLEFIICGGAHLDPKYIEFFDNLGIPIMNGYGVTECSPVVCCNTPRYRKLDSVGVPAPLPYCEVEIIENEICVRGSIVAPGYYNDLKATSQAFYSGQWFRTGDLGYFDNEGFLYLSGRIKNLITLGDGNNVSPEAIEACFQEYPIVQSVLVCARKKRKAETIAALIFPNRDLIPDDEQFDLNREIEQIISQINRNNRLSQQIRIFEIVSDDFERNLQGEIKRYLYSQ